MQMPTLGKSSPCKSLGSPNRVYAVMAGQGRSTGVVTACHPGEGLDKGGGGGGVGEGASPGGGVGRRVHICASGRDELSRWHHPPLAVRGRGLQGVGRCRPLKDRALNKQLPLSGSWTVN